MTQERRRMEAGIPRCSTHRKCGRVRLYIERRPWKTCRKMSGHKAEGCVLFCHAGVAIPRPIGVRWRRSWTCTDDDFKDRNLGVARGSSVSKQLQPSRSDRKSGGQG
ncbi:hypothetical protein OG21DRAFT_286196 [Imleria badia]|nr:hypothetical protein OG21DRAFT_286196 [Imleria badia]